MFAPRQIGVVRDYAIRVRCTKEEFDLLTEAAGHDESFTATWARDTLIARALRLRSQRLLLR